MRKTREEDFAVEVRRLCGDNHVVVGSTSVHGRICFYLKHRECGGTYLISKQNFFLGRRCPRCWVHSGKKNTAQFKKEVEHLVGNEYVVLGEYIGSKQPIEMRHDTVGCGRSFEIKPNRFMNGIRCPKCFGMQRDFAKEMFDLVGSEYTLLDFIRFSSKAIFVHNKCGYVYRALPSEFLRECRCPRCRESVGERMVQRYLDAKKITYKRQYRFADCRFKRSLPFDFAVFDGRGGIVCLIEYDGRQHSEIVKDWGMESIDIVQKRDAIKDAYCKKKDIRLIRIDYKDMKRIGSILDVEVGNELSRST